MYWGSIRPHELLPLSTPSLRPLTSGSLPMLDREWRGIVVGNGHGTLAELRGAPRVFFAQRKYAAGVLEGLRSLGFLDREA